MDSEYVELDTKLGKLKGLIKKSVGKSEQIYYSFQGIPYAKPPVGELRFQAPEPFGQWEGTLDATKEGNDCFQRHMLFRHITGDEDCLYLNVYTTKNHVEERSEKAVMVWIHGGGFGSGSGSSELYGPDFLIEEDIVLVSINYRCGAFGFLSLENESVPGNFGLKDQVLAFCWVRDNISSFGGDPNNVTIFGESAGGASVNYHLLSPLSKGLFHKAILQSGSSLCPWAFQNNPRKKALLLASQLGCTSNDNEAVLQFLKSIPAIDIVKAQDSLILRTGKETIQQPRAFLPCIEEVGNVSFLTDHPRKLMNKGELSDVPIIIGVVDKEGLLALSANRIDCDIVNSDTSVMVPIDLNTTAGSEEEKALGREVLKFYTNTDTLSWDINVIKGYIDLISDLGFCIAAEDTRQMFLKHINSPVYSYMFSYISPRAMSHTLIPMAYPELGQHFVGLGASHGDELIHQFKTNTSQIPYHPPSEDDEIFMKKFLKAWVAFAKTGDPNCKEFGTTWDPDSLKKPHFLELGIFLRQVDGTTFPERMEFWENIYQKYSYNL